MARIALALFVLFAALLVLRALRLFLAPRAAAASARTAASMARWSGIRSAASGSTAGSRSAGRQGDQWLPVCSEKCRRALESP